MNSKLTTLDVREAINIFLSIATFVMAVLYIRFIASNCLHLRWIKIWSISFPWFRCLANKYEKPALQAAIAWAILSIGESIRATFVWEVLHFDRHNSTYAAEVYPLMGALLLIVFGALCSIRVFSPTWLGNWLWIGTLIITSILVLVNFAVLDYHIFNLGIN